VAPGPTVTAHPLLKKLIPNGVVVTVQLGPGSAVAAGVLDDAAGRIAISLIS
jgi:hypothetical protein